MSMQNGSKRRPPNIIARLMGLDGLPPQSSSPSQSKSVENQHRRPITSEKARGKNAYGDHEHFRRCSMDEQKFKDVFEVLDAEKEKSSRSLYQRRVNANLSEAETDEKFLYSKGLNENLEALDSDKDHLLKFLHHPDSLFAKHLPDLQSIAPKPQCSQATTLKLSNSPNREDNIKTPKGVSHRSPQWHVGGASPSHSNTRGFPYEDTIKLSKKRLKERIGMKLTEIVVLKPNLGKQQTSSRALPSQCSSSDEVRADRRLPCTRNQESNAFGSLKANEDVNLLRKKPIDPRAIAKILSRQMKVSSGNDSSKNFEISRFRGYAGDESSSGSDSSSEFKLGSVISRARTDFNRKNNLRSPPFRLSESPVSKEAKSRLSERWNLASKSEQEIEIRRRNTLAEMLTTSDREASPASFYGISFQEGLTKRFESNVGQPELPEPIGISSRDGWKSTGKKNLSKDRTTMHQDRSCAYTIVLPKKLTTRDGLVKGNSFHSKDLFLSTKSRVSSNSYFSENSSSEINRPNSSETLYRDGKLSEERLLALKIQCSLSVHADSDTEKGSEYEDAKSAPSLKPPDLSAVTSLTEPDISGRPTEEVDSSSIPQLQPRESAKEGNQPSPVSILQTSFHDGYSSSPPECFESITADLQGLRMQLQLLKLESATYNEGAMLVPSDEEADKEDSSIVTDELREDWKSLYLTAILENSRFSDFNPQSFMATWHSSESPLDPSMFEDLEKKCDDLKTSTRFERKLLFDRINSEILELFEQFTDLKPTKVCPKWDMNRIHKTLRELVSVKYKKPSRDSKEKEFQWQNLEDGMEVFGKKIEEMLTDELITELVIG